MKLLLDTHILIWADAAPRRLPPAVRRALERPSNERWFSPVSTFEASLLVDAGDIRIAIPFDEWFAALAGDLMLQEAPLTHEVVLASRDISLPHRDPADRLIAGTARYYGLRLVTADARMLQGKGFDTMPAR